MLLVSINRLVVLIDANNASVLRRLTPKRRRRAAIPIPVDYFDLLFVGVWSMFSISESIKRHYDWKSR
jgi:hypothetical protein